MQARGWVARVVRVSSGSVLRDISRTRGSLTVRGMHWRIVGGLISVIFGLVVLALALVQGRARGRLQRIVLCSTAEVGAVWWREGRISWRMVLMK